MNVSSIVVKTSSETMEEVISSINEIDSCEVHFHDEDGKIVVTIEGRSIYDQIGKMKLIQSLSYVYSANLMYAYCEDEMSDAMENIESDRGSVPDGLIGF